MTDALVKIPIDPDLPKMLSGRLLADLAKEGAPPPTLPCTLEEWQAMSEPDRLIELEWFVGELRENTEGIGIQFPRIKYPSSGTTFWQIDTGEPELMPVSALVGVILKKAESRVFYIPTEGDDDSITEGAIPDCFSGDKIFPDPEASAKQHPTCSGCPQSKWGSGKHGAGQACKVRVRVYTALRSLAPGKNNRMECAGPIEEVPTFISLPPTSIKPVSLYVTALTNQKKALSTVLTRFGLKSARSKDGKNEYSALDPSNLGVVTKIESQMIRALKVTWAEGMKYRSGREFLDDIAADTKQQADFPSGADPDLDGKDGPEDEMRESIL